MRLQQLFFEDKCRQCSKRMSVSDFMKSKDLCTSCSLKTKKRKQRDQEEEDIRHRMTQASDANLLNVAQQMPDRGHDAKRGTAGWVMGGLSPGRSF